MEWPTVGQWIVFLVILVLGSLVVGLIDAWWEKRKEAEKIPTRAKEE